MRIVNSLAIVLIAFAACACAGRGSYYTGAEVKKAGTYRTGVFDESAAEIVAFDSETNQLFIVNGHSDGIDIVNIEDVHNPKAVKSLELKKWGKSANSVAFKNGILAVAVEADPKQQPGNVVLFDAQGRFLAAYKAGALPDMVTFTPDGKYVLAACEGEPNEDYSFDPEGSVTIIDISKGVDKGKAHQADFTGFNSSKASLQARGVRISHPGSSVAQDVEPEYIAVSGDSKTAYVALQENNAMAVVDIVNARIVDILPLGLKDWGGEKLAFDASDKDGIINMQVWPVYSAYMPDSVDAYEVDGKTYIISANEGDSREYGDYEDEGRVGKAELDAAAFPNGDKLKNKKNLGRYKYIKDLSDTDGDGDLDRIVGFGGRSFSIWDVQGNLIYDSGNEFSEIIAGYVPEYFNTSNDKNKFDNRSDDKGCEPEGVAVGQINGRWYAFIGLERMGGIMVYDVTDPKDPVFVQYVLDRNFKGDPKKDQAGDLGPEGLHFINAEDSPSGNNLLVVGNEVSGSTTIYEIFPFE